MCRQKSGTTLQGYPMIDRSGGSFLILNFNCIYQDLHSTFLRTRPCADRNAAPSYQRTPYWITRRCPRTSLIRDEWKLQVDLQTLNGPRCGINMIQQALNEPIETHNDNGNHYSPICYYSQSDQRPHSICSRTELISSPVHQWPLRMTGVKPGNAW